MWEGEAEEGKYVSGRFERLSPYMSLTTSTSSESGAKTEICLNEIKNLIRLFTFQMRNEKGR